MPKKGNAQTAHLDPCEVPSTPPPPAREINIIETYSRNWHEKSNFGRKRNQNCCKKSSCRTI